MQPLQGPQFPFMTIFVILAEFLVKNSVVIANFYAFQLFMHQSLWGYSRNLSQARFNVLGKTMREAIKSEN